MEYDEIWTFIEDKPKTPVPNYIKYILQYCGYNNGISIASMQGDDDIQYFVDQVKNGNVSNFFEPINVLESSSKTRENFEFSRGHLKFLMAIVDFLRKYGEENGWTFFSNCQPNRGTKRRIQQTTTTSNKRKKVESNVSVNQNIEELVNEDCRKQKGMLLSRTIMSLLTHAPKIYVEVCTLQIL